MQKSLIPLGLALALVTPLANAGRLPAASDREPEPFAADQMRVARDVAELGGLERGSYRTLVVGAAVPGTVSAQCQVQLLGARGVLLEVATLDVPAGSSAQIDFADRIGLRMAAGAHVSCDQPFFAFAAAAAANDPKVVWAEGIGPNGACDFTVTAAELEPGVFVATQSGTIHTAAKEKAKGIVCVKVPRDLAISKLVLEWEVTPGPWSTKNPAGSHGMMFLHRGRFRSNTVANVNGFGPKKSFVKMNQNVDLSAATVTSQKIGIALQKGTVYNLRYIYDAASKNVVLELYQGTALLKRATMNGTARGRILSVLAKGLSDKGALFAELGHFAGQHPPEMPSYGWRYANLRVEMHVKP